MTHEQNFQQWPLASLEDRHAVAVQLHTRDIQVLQ